MKRMLIMSAVMFGFVIWSGLAAAQEGGTVQLEFSVNPEPVTVTVSGRITDAETGEPISDALVRGHIVVWANRGPELFDKSPYQVTSTDSDGDYELKFATPLTTTGAMKGKDGACVYVSKPGYETKPQYVRPRVTFDKTAFTGVDIALEKGRCLKGRVVDEHKQPIALALVKAQNGLNGDWNHFGALGRARTGPAGEFELWLTKAAGKEHTPRWLELWKEGYGVAFLWDFAKDDLGEIVVPRGGTIAGRVVDTEGKGVAGCEMVAQTMMWDIVGSAKTDADGNYELSGIPGAPGVVEFFKAKNKQWMDLWGEATVYARTDPEMNLRSVPQYKITPKESQTLTGPELIVGADVGVSGILLAGENTFGLQGLLVRLDYDWDNMVEADAKGEFSFPYVPPGKRRVTAYLPTNLRGDRGIGSVEVTVEPGEPIEGVRIQLQTLSEARVQFVDADGNPLGGITAGATWTKDGSGFWTEGTRSGEDGWAVLYLYPGSVQYIRGFDASERKLVSANHEKVEPEKGEVVDHLRVTMVAAAGVSGKMLDENHQPIASRRFLVNLSYADGGVEEFRADTDASGAFEVKPRLRPGVVTLAAETSPLEFKGATEIQIEVRPGEVTDLGNIILQKVNFYKVSGTAVPSTSLTKVDGLKIRLDLTARWQFVGETDAEGRFEVEVPEGEHRLTAYVPWNLRFDPGIGHVDVDATADIEGVELPLDDLAVIRMTIVDQNGIPLEGMSGITTFRENMTGPGNAGPPSDENGLSTIYVYPGHDEYAAPFDKSRKLRWKEVTKVNLEEGEIIEMTGVLVPAEEE